MRIFSFTPSTPTPHSILLAAVCSTKAATERMGHAPVGVDVLTKIPGIEFDAAWPRRVQDVIDEKTGLQATLISADDLIIAKLASGRLQDLADASAMRTAPGLFG